MKRAIVLVLALLSAAVLAEAQSKAPLQIFCNVSGAQVFLAGQLVGNTTPNLTLNIRQGTWALTIIKHGYVRFDTTVNVGPEGANVQANLFMPGAAVAPTTIPAPNTIPAPRVFNYGLSVSSNVGGATVFINGNPAGQTPFTGQLPNGSYMVLVRAPGYMDFGQTVVVGNGPVQINAMLQPMLASWQLRLPENFMNRDTRPGHPREIQVWVDGAIQPEAQWPVLAAGQLMPGRHNIRIVSGALAAETQLDVQAGRAYILEPILGIDVKQ